MSHSFMPPETAADALLMRRALAVPEIHVGLMGDFGGAAVEAAQGQVASWTAYRLDQKLAQDMGSARTESGEPLVMDARSAQVLATVERPIVFDPEEASSVVLLALHRLVQHSGHLPERRNAVLELLGRQAPSWTERVVARTALRRALKRDPTAGLVQYDHARTTRGGNGADRTRWAAAWTRVQGRVPRHRQVVSEQRN